MSFVADTIGLAFAREALGPWLRWTLGGLALAGTLGGVGALWTPGAVLAPLDWMAVTVLAMPAALSVVVPATASAAVLIVMGRWTDGGGWTGVRASGMGGRTLAPAVVLLGLASAAVTATSTLWMEPVARRQAARVVHEGRSALELWPGALLHLGSFAIRVEGVDDSGWTGVFVADGQQVVTARRGGLARKGSELVLLLEDGAATGPGSPWHTRFDRLTLPLPEASGSRIELSHRSTADLARTARRTEVAGGDASYEWAVLHKRWLHPLGALLAPWAVLPLGTRRRRWALLGSTGLGYVVAVRVGDHGAAALGPVLAASAGPVWVGVVGLVAWLTWRDR